MKHKKIWIITGILLLLTVFINNRFLYNPIEFESIESVKWYDFQKPVFMELETLDDEVDEYYLSNEDEIKFIYNELNNSDTITENEYKIGGGRFIWFHFMSGTLNGSSEPILLVDVRQNGTCEIGGNTYVKINDELWDYFKSLKSRNTVKFLLKEE